MSQTFAPGYVRPGTYVEVQYQQVPNAIVPPFVTALVGRTASYKPATTVLVRNAATSTGVYADSNNLITTAVDADETIRRDLIDTYDDVAVDSNGDLVVTSLLDSLGSGHIKGSSEEWVTYNTGTSAADKVYVEWVAKYYPAPSGANDEVFCGGMADGRFVSIAGVTQEDQEVQGTAFADQTTEISAADGLHSLTLALAGTVYTLTWDAETPVTGLSTDTTVSEHVFSSIKVLIDGSKFPANLGTGSTFYDAVTVSTAGPASGTGVTTGAYSVSTHGVEYTVYYGKPKGTDDFVVQRFDDLATLQNFHGAIVSTTGTDYLSLGATPYFQAGGGPVYAVPLRDKAITNISTDPDLTNDSGYVEAVRQALVLLENEPSVSCVVVLSPSEVAGNGNFRPAILGLVKSHCINMSSVTNTAKDRMGILGGVANETNETVFISAAEALDINRMVYVCPATAALSAGGFTFVCDGSTISAGLAGILSNPGIDAGEPISGKPFDMFDSITDSFTETQKNRMAAAGVCIIETVGGATSVRHFLSTDPSNPLLAEAKVTRIEIDVRRSLKTACDAVLINTRYVPGQTLGTLRTVVGNVLDTKRNANIIVDYKINKVAINPVEPRQLDVDVAIAPTFDNNWIYIKATFQVSIS